MPTALAKSTANLSTDLRARLADRVADQLRKRQVPVPERAGVATQKVMPSFHDWLEEVSPSYNWDYRHVVYLQQKFEEWIAGKYKHIAFYLPPRHFKSETITVRGAAYLIEKDPTTRVMIAAYDSPLAQLFSRKVRGLLRGRVAFSKEKDSQEEWETQEGGGLRAVGLRAGITGRGFNWIFVDDPIPGRREAESQAFRDAVYSGYTDDVYTRLEPGAKICWIQTKWHYDDPSGRIERSETAHEWHFVTLPALAEENDPIGREVGEALCPERYDVPALLAIKATLVRTWIALYQQRPSPAEGSILQLSWFGRYRTPPAHYKRIVQSWDTAMKGAEVNDPWAILTLAEGEDGNFYILDGARENYGYPEGKAQVKTQYLRWLPGLVLIEDKSSGEALIQEYKKEKVPEAPGQRIPIRKVEPYADKITRASIASDSIAAGLFYLPESATWLPEFEDEIRSFPLSAYDHYVDALSQAIDYLVSKKAKMSLASTMQLAAKPAVIKDGYEDLPQIVLPTTEEMERLQEGWTWRDIQRLRR